MPPLLTVSQCSFRFSLQRFLLLLYHGNRIVVFFCAAICSSLGRLKKLNPTNNIPIRTRPVMVFLSILILITNYINYKLPVVYHVSLAVHRCFFVFDGSFHKCNEQRMRVQYRTAIFRMELCTDKPFQSRDFNDFYQIRFRVDTYTFHAGSFISVFIIIVELIAMAVTFLNMFLSVSLICFRTFCNTHS